MKNFLRLGCFHFAVGFLFCLPLTNCMGNGKNGRKGLLPTSTGQPYEVVLEGDTDSIVTRILMQEVEGLPQAEPMCDLIQVRQGKARGSYLLVRNRVIVSINEAHKGFAVTMSKDENAYPQLIIRIMAKDSKQLTEHLNGKKLRSLIDQQEVRHLADIIQQNPSKQEEIKRLFGIDMKLPASIDASKLAKNFAWYSNNANTGMQSILLMKLSKKSHHDLITEINNVLHKNMPGETDDMYMQLTTADSVAHNSQGSITKGLWEMEGDAMGGPYILRQLGDIVMIGFVYAPEKKKRNLTRQLEAVLTTAQKTK